jgi:probable rRNA maturation factor
MSATVFGYDEQLAVPVDLDRWVALAERVLASEGIAVGELTLAFVDEADMAELNEEHMGETYATDVLSFPLDADAASAVGELHEGNGDAAPVLLGDVVVCPSVALANAPEHAGTVDDELALLIVHGVLHLLGHDHAEPTDTTQMQARERTLLEQLHWNGPAPASFGAHKPQP